LKEGIKNIEDQNKRMVAFGNNRRKVPLRVQEVVKAVVLSGILIADAASVHHWQRRACEGDGANYGTDTQDDARRCSFPLEMACLCLFYTYKFKIVSIYWTQILQSKIFLDTHCSYGYNQALLQQLFESLLATLEPIKKKNNGYREPIIILNIIGVYSYQMGNK
jgi:hypothetical protein